MHDATDMDLLRQYADGNLARGPSAAFTTAKSNRRRIIIYKI
jgi:hypothetical protein